MNAGRSIFSQLIDFLPKHDFHTCVRRYGGQRRLRSLSCLDQFLSMAFAQLTYRDSLRDIETCLRVLGPRLYHSGFRGDISRSTLADANQNRDWRIYADFAQVLIGRARTLYAKDGFGVALEQTAYAFDSTTIDLCLTLFPWARFRRRKAAVKLHTLIDLRGNIPCFICVTDGKTHDVNALDQLPLEAGAFYMIDRGYIDFRRLAYFTKHSAFFVTRAKKNFDYNRRCSRSVDKSTGLRSDQTVVLGGIQSAHDYPDPLRRVSYSDNTTRKRLVFLTNNFTLPALAIPQLYKRRWSRRAGILQMDQTTLMHQNILRHIGERGEDSGLDCHQRLRPGGPREKRITPRQQFERNSANSERHAFRENAYFLDVFERNSPSREGAVS